MRLGNRILVWLGVAGGLLAVAVASYVVGVTLDAGGGSGFASKNPSGAMEPTLLVGDYFTARPLPPAGAIARGEIVVHVYPPDTTKHFVKRIVALPGDTLAMRHGVLVVDGREVAEPYAWHSEPVAGDSAAAAAPVGAEDFRWQRDYLTTAASAATYRPTRNDWGPIELPPDAYFVLGDNRDNSLDSRYFGFVTRPQLLGRARLVYFSRDPETGTIRWSRFGHPLR